MTGSTLLGALAAAAVSVASMLLVTAAIWWIDRYDREPNRLVVLCFLGGATVAPLLSLTLVGRAQAVFASAAGDPAAIAPWLVLLAATSSEALKALVVGVIVTFGADLDNPADGVVFSVAAGAGYSLTANLLPGPGWAGAGDGLHNPAPTLAAMLLVCGVHLTSGAVFGGGLGAASLTRRARRVAWISGGLLVAVLVHAGWDLLSLEAAGGGWLRVPWPAILAAQCVLFALTIGWFFRLENRILDRQLSEEVKLGVVPSWVVDVIPYYRRRVRSSWWPHRRERTVLSRLMSRLAFRKHAVLRLPEAEAQLAGLEVVKLRHRIRGMLDPGTDRREGSER